MRRFWAFALATLLGTAFGQGLSSVNLRVDEREAVKPFDPALLGFNFDWTGQQSAIDGFDLKNPTWHENGGGGLREDVSGLLKGFPINLSRIAGTSSQYLSWKKAIGSVSARAPQKLESWWAPYVPGYGPIEWIKEVRSMDPSSKYVWCVNLMESPQEAADLCAFLTGDPKAHRGPGENWAAKRVALGIEKPISIYAWELGNESDGNDAWSNYPSIASYTERCLGVMAAIRAVDPGARFAAQASTMCHQKGYKEKYGGDWDIWHRTVLKEIGSKIDFLVYHPYFGKSNQPGTVFFANRQRLMEKDILEITGENRIRFLISEYGFWPEKTPAQTKWEQSWYTTHALVGCLSTADWIARMVMSPWVSVAAMHSFCSGPWGVWYANQRDDSGKSTKTAPYLTGQGELFRFANRCLAAGKMVVSATATGDRADLYVKGCSFTPAVVRTERGLNLFLVNQEPEAARQVEFEAQGRYTVGAMETFTGPSLHSQNNSTGKELVIEKSGPKPGEFRGLTVPARSIVAVELRRL